MMDKEYLKRLANVPKNHAPDLLRVFSEFAKIRSEMVWESLLQQLREIPIDSDFIERKKSFISELLPAILHEGELNGLASEKDKRLLQSKFWEEEKEWTRNEEEKQNRIPKLVILEKYRGYIDSEIKKLEGPISGPSNLDRLFKSDDDKRFAFDYMKDQDVIGPDHKFIAGKSRGRASRRTKLKAFIMVFKDKLFGGKSEEEVTPIICSVIDCRRPKSNRLSENNREAYKTFLEEVEKNTDLYLNNKEDYLRKTQKNAKNTEEEN